MAPRLGFYTEQFVNAGARPANLAACPAIFSARTRQKTPSPPVCGGKPRTDQPAPAAAIKAEIVEVTLAPRDWRAFAKTQPAGAFSNGQPILISRAGASQPAARCGAKPCITSLLMSMSGSMRRSSGKRLATSVHVAQVLRPLRFMPGKNGLLLGFTRAPHNDGRNPMLSPQPSGRSACRTCWYSPPIPAW